ncbi:MAG TPA: ABC transporter substrate-binding protein [Geothrix sp.]|nr:ABC transporter substrate-binding protein [Geothrix sp.]
MRWLLLVLPLCLGLAAQEPIRVGVNEWFTVNPLLMTQDTDAEVTDLIFDRLITMDAQGNFIPEMLESWKISPDGREILLKLRPGLTWQDGQPIEAEDLVFTWKMLRQPEIRKLADTTPGVASLDSLEVVGPLQVRIRLKRPRGTLLPDLYSFVPVPRRHYRLGAKPETAPINFKPIGSGPYRVVGTATTKSLSLERWDGYRGIHPGTWPAFELKDLTEEKRIIPAFEEGRVHFVSTSALRYYLVRKGAVGTGLVEAVSVPQAAFGAFFLNCDPRLSVLGDVEVRRALAELIPWKSKARAMRFFPAQMASSFWPPQSWAHDPTPRPLPQVEHAAEILDRAGWKLGSDGFRHDASGRLLQIVAYDGAKGNLSDVYQLALQAAKVGFKVERREVSFAVLTKNAADHNGDLWSFGWVLSLDPDVDSPLFTEEGYRTKANVSSYLNPEIDKLFEEGKHTLDPQARQQIYRRISEIIYRDKPILPMTYTQNRILHSLRLKGVVFDLLGQSYGFWPGRRAWKLEAPAPKP